MAPRHNACRVVLRVPDAVSASKAHQPEHKQLAQCGSDEQRAALLQADVDVVDVLHIPLLRVSLQRSAAAEHDLPALHAASRRQAVQGMRRELGDECKFRASHRKSRVRCKPGDEGVARMLTAHTFLLVKCSVTGRRRSMEKFLLCYFAVFLLQLSLGDSFLRHCLGNI
jgi:hypothetical protein